MWEAHLRTHSRINQRKPICQKLWLICKWIIPNQNIVLTSARVAAAVAAFCSWSSSEFRGNQLLVSGCEMTSVMSWRRECWGRSSDCIGQPGTNSCCRPPLCHINVNRDWVKVKDKKQVISEMLFPTNLLASTEETKPNSPQKNKHKKLKLRLILITYTHAKKRKENNLNIHDTSGSAMAEGPRDALVSRNSATTKHPIWKLESQTYRVALFAWSYV